MIELFVVRVLALFSANFEVFLSLAPYQVRATAVLDSNKSKGSGGRGPVEGLTKVSFFEATDN